MISCIEHEKSFITARSSFSAVALNYLLFVVAPSMCVRVCVCVCVCGGGVGGGLLVPYLVKQSVC